MRPTIVTTNVSQAQSLWSDFYGEGHVNENYALERFT